MVSAEEKSDCAKAFPIYNKYDLIVADPPWTYRSTGSNVQGTTPYDTMSVPELQALPVSAISENDCILLLWATWPKMEEALSVMKAWGFDYKTCYKLWRKVTKSGTPHFGCGWWSRGNSEVLLIGAKGKRQAARLKRRDIAMEFSHPRTSRHSEKPSQIMADILNDITATKRIDLFCRGQPYSGFDGWGLECKPYYFARASTSDLLLNTTDTDSLAQAV